MLGLENKLEELKELKKSGLIDKDEYIDLKTRAMSEFGKLPESLPNSYTTQTKQRSQQQRTYTTQRTQNTQRSQTSKSQQKKGKGCLVPYAIFIIASILIGFLSDCS